MSVTALYGSTVIVCAASLVIGQAILATCGWRRWSWLAPAMGMAALILVCGATLRIPGDGLAPLAAAVLLFIAGALSLRGRVSGLADAARAGLPVGLIVLAAVSIPFAASGRIDLLGPLVLDDIATHVAVGEYLLSGEGPRINLLDNGYPLGVHAVAAAISKGTGAPFDASFTGFLLATPVLTSLTALTVLGGLPAWRRTVAAVLVGLPYLAACFLVQSSYKELALALLVIAFALTLHEIRRGPVGERPGRLARAVPLGLLAAAAVYVYSYFGLAWFTATLGLWSLAELFRRGSGPLLPEAAARLRRALPPVAVGTAAFALGLAPAVAQLASFAAPVEPGNQVIGVQTPRHFYEALGVWPSPDYRFSPEIIGEGLSAGLGLAALGFGVLWWSRGRGHALIAALVACVVAFALSGGNSFYQDKALVLIAPIAMLIAVSALLAPWRGARPLAAITRSGLASLFVAGAAYSSYLGLQGARVDTPEQGRELANLRSIIGERPTVFLGRDKFAGLDLRGARVASPAPLEWLGTQLPPRPQKRLSFLSFEPLDFDHVTAHQLDYFAYAITSRATYRSAPPPNFRAVRSTRSFTLWKRRGPTLRRHILGEGPAPGIRLKCTPPARRQAARRGGRAGVFTVPPLVDRRLWEVVPDSGYSDTPDLRKTVDLPRGRWRVSLQYISQTQLELTAPGLRLELPPNMDHLATFWPGGTVMSRGRPITLTLHATGRSWFARLLDRQFLLRQYIPERLGGQIAFVRPRSYAVIPLRLACGRYVDWFRLGRREA